MSYTFPTTKILYNATTLQPVNPTRRDGSSDFECWSIFRTGSDWWEGTGKPSSILEPGQSIQNYLANTIAGESAYQVIIDYDEEFCGSYKGSATSIEQLENEYNSTTERCLNEVNLNCNWDRVDPTDQNGVRCRLSVRMQAAITLAGALVIKAAYMISWIWRMRGKMKTKCLTFGDVIAASALNPELQVSNECLVNAGDAYRKAVDHTCHKHCKSDIPSATGDELGHCQKCQKWNRSNMAAGLEHPIVATKYKKSLITNLGSNAVIQMILLTFGSMAMVGVSIYVAVDAGLGVRVFEASCREDATDSITEAFDRDAYNTCMQGSGENWKAVSGAWGGFNESRSLSSLHANSIGSESASFLIANGAQLQIGRAHV